VATNLQDLRQQSGTAVAEKKPNLVVEALAKSANAMKAVLPKHLTPERMSRMALGVLRTNNSLRKAAEANPASFAHAVVMAGQLGLEIGAFGEAHLVPFGDEITLIPGYQGLVKLAKNTGLVIDIYAHEVRENDKFELTYGLDRTLKHTPLSKGGFPASDDERGPIVGFYAVAVLKDGTRTFWAMSTSDINETRDASRGYQAAKRYKKESPWDTHYEAMGRKTVVRALCNWLPKSAEVRAAIDMDYALDQGRHVKTLDADFTVETTEAEAEDPPKVTDKSKKEDPPPADDPHAGEERAPTLDELKDLVAEGRMADAREVCPPELKDALEAMITSRTNATKQAAPKQAAQQQRDPFE